MGNPTGAPQRVTPLDRVKAYYSAILEAEPLPWEELRVRYRAKRDQECATKNNELACAAAMGLKHVLECRDWQSVSHPQAPANPLGDLSNCNQLVTLTCEGYFESARVFLAAFAEQDKRKK